MIQHEPLFILLKQTIHHNLNNDIDPDDTTNPNTLKIWHLTEQLQAKGYKDHQIENALDQEPNPWEVEGEREGEGEEENNDPT